MTATLLGCGSADKKTHVVALPDTSVESEPVAQSSISRFATEGVTETRIERGRVKLKWEHRPVLFRPAGGEISSVAASPGGYLDLNGIIDIDELQPEAESVLVEVGRSDSRAAHRVKIEHALNGREFVPARLPLTATEGLVEVRWSEILTGSWEIPTPWVQTLPGDHLSFAYGTMNRDSAEVDFSVEFESETGARTALFAERIDQPFQRARWNEADIDLDSAAGARGRFVFRTEILGSPLDFDGLSEVPAPIWGSPMLYPARAEPKSGPPNLIIISLDTLRADHLGCYGYPKPTSPNIDALARESWLFEQCTAASSWTTPSHASLFSGVHPALHPQGDQPRYRVPNEMTMLAERMRDRGYVTAGFTEGLLVGGDFGFAQGFDVYSDGDPSDSMVSGRAEETFGYAKSWLDRFAHLPFYLFVHTYEIHAPYHSPEPYLTQWRGGGKGIQVPVQDLTDPVARQGTVDLYDGSIAYTDAVVGDFLGYLRSRGIEQNTFVILLSDHGEEFWEHGRADHGRALFYESVHVPLLIRAPGNSPSSSRIPDPVSLNDVYATVLEWVDIPDTMADDSYSLIPLMSGDPEAYDRRLVTSSLRVVKSRYLYLAAQDGPSRYLVGASFDAPDSLLGDYDALFDRQAPIESTFMRRVREFPPPPLEINKTDWREFGGPAREFLFDHATDPAESMDTAADEAVLHRLRTALDDYLREISGNRVVMAPETVQLTQEEKAQLDAMGYF